MRLGGSGLEICRRCRPRRNGDGHAGWRTALAAGGKDDRVVVPAGSGLAVEVAEQGGPGQQSGGDGREISRFAAVDLGFQANGSGAAIP